MSFPVPANSAQTELEIKKSRFISHVGFAASRGEAMTLLAQAKQAYPDARHHGWAYVIGDPATPEAAAMSDDGEPSGTAGKPILNVLQHKQVGNIMLIVVRYFGGIKLGAGGLVRAYSAAAQAAMNEVEIKREVPISCVSVVTEFAHEQYIRHWLEQHDGMVDKVDYSSRVTMTITLPVSVQKAFFAALGPIGTVISQTKAGRTS
ncbi:YigZ family protein [Alteromonas ponticola]|uniref:YigZ family protein n=1 Tax=Alteromonas ponticola TaxID=2720613 RepID=A0ABX1R4Y1_9ALTE|nr:YigZ family protein [Alteromonas ponticola]NMH60546.1 YigZ family protein [Alteromonas ponticola]